MVSEVDESDTGRYLQGYDTVSGAEPTCKLICMQIV